MFHVLTTMNLPCPTSVYNTCIYVKHILLSSHNLNLPFTEQNRTALESRDVISLLCEREGVKFLWMEFTCISLPNAPHTPSKFSVYIL